MIFNEKYHKLALMTLLITRDRVINRTSLNKLLFFSDLIHFLGDDKKSKISGVPYFRKPYGPVPDNIDAVRVVLISGELMSETVYDSGMYNEYSYISTSKVNFAKVEQTFQDTEIDAINTVLENMSSWTASKLSEFSHKYAPWNQYTDWDVELDFHKAANDKNLMDELRQLDLLN